MTLPPLIQLDGPPARWVSKHGRPAPVLPGGLPSYERMDGDGIVVLEFAIFWFEATGQARLLPRNYGVWCVVAPEGPIPMHHDPDALWDYRTNLYRLTMDGMMQALGSQQEIMWRKILGDTMAKVHADYEPPDYAAADARAEALLREHLSPQQLLEYEVTGNFRVRGGQTRNVYLIESANGFKLINRYNEEPLKTFCLHPEHYLPHADVALATKLALEDRDGEEEALKGARSGWQTVGHQKITEAHRHAERHERTLIQ